MLKYKNRPVYCASITNAQNEPKTLTHIYIYTLVETYICMYYTTLVYILLLYYVCVCTKSTLQSCEKYLKLVGRIGRDIQWTTLRKYE